MNEFFINCRDLIEVNLTNLTTEKILTTSDMFNGCTHLTNVDLTNFDSTNLKR